MNLNLNGWNEYIKQQKRDGEFINWQSFTDKGKNRIVVFDSGSDLIECIQNNLSLLKSDPTSMLNYCGRTNDWAFGEYETFGATTEALTCGQISQKYINKVGEAKDEIYRRNPELANLEVIAMSKRRRRKFAEVGDELDIDRYMCNDPAMWQSNPPGDIVKRTARFYIDIWGSCSTDFNQFINGVVYAVALGDIIEKAGISLEIIVGASCDHFLKTEGHGTVCFTAKRADEPIDISKLLTYGLSGFLRAYIFSIYELIKDRADVYSGYGSKLYGTVQSIQPINADVEFWGADNYTNPKTVQITISKVKEVFNLQ